MAKTGGRQKGTPNKVTADVKAIALAYTADAIAGLVGIAQDTQAPPAARVSAWKEILDRAVGKAPQALTDPDGGPIGIKFTFALDKANRASDA